MIAEPVAKAANLVLEVVDPALALPPIEAAVAAHVPNLPFEVVDPCLDLLPLAPVVSAIPVPVLIATAIPVVVMTPTVLPTLRGSEHAYQSESGGKN
jgi:hypothetical protein